MVKRILFFLLISCSMVSLPTWAQYQPTFIAKVNRNSLTINETFTLELILSQASPLESPKISNLDSHFQVISTSQLSYTNIINGKINKNRSWTYRLRAKQTGSFTIPAFFLKTQLGKLNTNPITITVTGPNTSSSTLKKNAGQGIKIISNVSNETPYQYEPIIYTVQLVTQKKLSELRYLPEKIEDAFIVQNGPPKSYKEVNNGITSYFTELSYLVVPLKEGVMSLPLSVFQGQITPQDPFSLSDPTSIFSQLITSNSKVFAQSSEPKFFKLSSIPPKITVKAPETNLDIWLPARTLTIKEEWDNTQEFMVGKPILRSFTTSARGVTANQLSKIALHPLQLEKFKVYEDLPESQEEIINQDIISTFNKNYTLIPLEPGEYTLPEISIPWWNLKKNQISYSTIPQRKITVIPDPAANMTAPPLTTNQAPQVPQDLPSIDTEQHDVISSLKSMMTPVTIWLMGIITVLFLMIIIIFIRSMRINQKLQALASNMEHHPQSDPQQASKVKPVIKNLPQTTNAKEIFLYLQRFAHTNWELSHNASLGTILTTLIKRLPEEEQRATDLFKLLEGALYFHAHVDIKDLKTQLRALMVRLKNTSPPKRQPKANDHELPGLNP